MEHCDLLGEVTDDARVGLADRVPDDTEFPGDLKADLVAMGDGDESSSLTVAAGMAHTSMIVGSQANVNTR